MHPVIRTELPVDIPAIHALTVAAFLHAPHTDHTEQFIVDALRKAGALTLSLVAEHGNSIVGHLAISPVSISDDSQNWFGLGPISVQPEFQRRGIGRLLIHDVLRRLREQGAAGCVLLGDPRYYSRFGFKVKPELILADVPPGYFQALSFGSSLPRGTVTYHPAFNARE
jgi:putative acetyltransferase